MANTQDVFVKAKVLLEGGLTIGPDECLIIRLPLNTSMAEYDEARTRMNVILPEDLRDRVFFICAEEFAKVEKDKS
jgi:hypothetical protein